MSEELSVNEALRLGVEAHKAGKVQEADRYYTAILQTQPTHPDANHNMGVLAVGIGKTEVALPFFKTALQSNPSIAQFWLSYIDALTLLGRLGEAKTALTEAKENGAKGGGFEELEQKLNVAINYNKGNLLQAQRKFDEAIECYNKSLGCDPNYAPAYNGMGNIFQEQGKWDEALGSYIKALDLKPLYVEAHYNIGNVYKRMGALDKAISSYKKALDIDPKYSHAYNNMGNALKEQGNFESAIIAYKRAIKITPDLAEACNNLGNTYESQGKLDDALWAYKKALESAPNMAEAFNNMGNVLKDLGKFRAAIDAYNKAQSIKPDYARHYNKIGNILENQGKRNEAIESYNKALSIDPGYAEVYRNLSIIKKYSLHDEQFLKLEGLLEKKELLENDRCNLSFALAKMYEDVGEFYKAFTHLVNGNELRKKLLNYSIESDENLFCDIKKAYSNVQINALKVVESMDSLVPIFIFGMPRSGTTLAEQIISSHSEVTGGGELHYVSNYGRAIALGMIKPSEENLAEFRTKYLSALSKVSNGKLFVTDKMPLNFLYLSVICAALPEAKLIHLQRDASAICWSNYRNYFAQKGLGYSCDLKNIVQYYNLYTNLMENWEAVYGKKIYNLRYETLTTNQEKITKSLISHLELAWEKSCLAPHKNKRHINTASSQQVRQKVYQGSSVVWRNYEQYLNGAFDCFI